jgi:hypothetical protein
MGCPFYFKKGHGAELSTEAAIRFSRWHCLGLPAGIRSSRESRVGNFVDQLKVLANHLSRHSLLYSQSTYPFLILRSCTRASSYVPFGEVAVAYIEELLVVAFVEELAYSREAPVSESTDLV